MRPIGIGLSEFAGPGASFATNHQSPGQSSAPDLFRTDVQPDLSFVAVDGRAQPPLREAVPALFEPDIAPWAHGGSGRRPAWSSSQKSSAEPAQLLILDHRRPPTWPRSLPFQQWIERSAVDHQFVAGAGSCDNMFVRHEHIVAGQNVLPVKPDLGDRGDSIQAEHESLTRWTQWRLKSRPEPPIFRVEASRGIIQRPLGKRA